MLKYKGGKILIDDNLHYTSYDIPIIVAIIAETKEQAISYFKRMIGTDNIQCNTQKGNNTIYTSPMLSVKYIEQYTFSCLGRRYNYCYCTQDVYESEWYKNCISPCEIGDTFNRIIY